MEIIRVGSTAAAAVKLGKAFFTFFLCIYIAALEFVTDFRVDDAVIHVAHEELLVSHKLVAGIQISPGSHCQVFRAGTAAGQTFCHTGTAL